VPAYVAVLLGRVRHPAARRDAAVDALARRDEPGARVPTRGRRRET
jgi:hypothetical protein